MITRKPTRRVCVDIGHKCNINCLHCYHKHEHNRDLRPFMIQEDIISEIEKGYYRGCNYVDFTGGETTLCAYLPDVIYRVADRWNVASCIITNALCGKNTFDRFVEAGTDDFLISLHGMDATHDAFTQRPGARAQQKEFIQWLAEAGKTFRANFCITSMTQNDILPFASWISGLKHCRIVNFINFNPHHGWSTDDIGTREMVADLEKTQHALDAAIATIELSGIGVNIRYYPMCRIAEQYRRCICNDLQVSFDPYEWDYSIDPKTPEMHMRWGIDASNGIEMKTGPCRKCKLQWICGGVNRNFYRAAGMACVTPVTDCIIHDPYDSYHYRKHNEMTLKEPRGEE